jgi:hypothetical protein
MSGCFPWTQPYAFWPVPVPVPGYPRVGCCGVLTPAPIVPPTCCPPPSCGGQTLQFCPQADAPAPVALSEGGGAGQVQVQLYGTLHFSAARTVNPLLPSGAQLIQNVTIQGNVLTFTTAAPILGDAGSYDAIITVSNCCGTWAIPVHVDVTP